MIPYLQFVAFFPEFSSLSQSTVENAIAQTEAEVNYYEGLHDPALQQQAVMLHTAHNLTLSGWAAEGKAGPVKSLASNNDKIDFAVNPDVGLSMDSTQYGVRLQNLLRRASTIFAVC